MAELVTGQQVADFLGRGNDIDLVALAGEHVTIVEAMVRAYVRGFNFDQMSSGRAGDAMEELAAVITTATARSVINPDQNIREQIGDYSVVPTVFNGFSLAETFVLNRYRKRAL